jgi:hypothetical protein
MASESPPDRALLRMLFALQRLPASLVSAILEDQELVARFKVPSSPRRLQLTPTASVERDVLLTAFRDAAQVGSASVCIQVDGQSLEVVVRIDPDGGGTLEAPGHRIRYAHVGLWLNDVERRRQVLAQILSQHTVTEKFRQELDVLVESSQFEPDTLVEASQILNTSPEEFLHRLSSAASTKSQFDEADFLPEDERHWDNITATPTHSKTLVQYTNDELRTERQGRLSQNPVGAFEMLSLQFSAQESVPHDWFELQEVDLILQCVEQALQFEDPFGLIGAFEICARNFARDPRLIELGDRLLERLFSDKPRMFGRCAAFGAIFVLSTARLAMHARTRDRPVYWRRFSAATHAALVVRAVIDGLTDDIFDKAMKMRQDSYMLSVYAEMRESPRWKPEWIDPHSLAADVYGRAIQAVQRIPDSELPPSWVTPLSQAAEWIAELGTARHAFFPSLTQGERLVVPLPVPDDVIARLMEFVQAMKEHPTPDDLNRLVNLIEMVGVTPEVVEGVREPIRGILAENRKNLDQFPALLTLSGRMAVLSRDAVLAEAVATELLQAAQSAPDGVPVFISVIRLLECAAADPDVVRAQETLTHRIEYLAGIVPAGKAALRLMLALKSLRRAHSAFAPMLGRAQHIAKLATPQIPLAARPSPDADAGAPSTATH